MRRSVRPLPYRLEEEAIIYLEEGLHTPAIQLLSNALLSGASQPAIPAQVPPPAVLSLLTTLCIHPNLTTRTDKRDRHASANAALFYLRDLVRIVDPLQNNTWDAWRFRVQLEGAGGLRRRQNRRQKFKRNDGRRSSGRNTPASASEDNEEDANELLIHSPFADDENIFQRVDDFWVFFGWCMRCAALYPHRWYRYKLLLTLMLEAAELDWAARQQLIKSRDSEPDTLAESLIVQWLGPASSRTALNRILKDIFSHGLDAHRADKDEKEIWPNETRLPPLQKEEPLQPGQKRKLVDIADDDLTNNAEENSDLPSSDAQNVYSKPLTSVEAYGGIEALNFRKRLLILLSSVAERLPRKSFDLHDYLDSLIEALRPAPFRIFIHFITRHSSRHDFSSNVQAALVSMSLQPLVAGRAPVYTESIPDLEQLKREYLPVAAGSSAHNGAVDNAKVAVLLEVMLRLCWEAMRDGQAEVDLTDAMERGIQAREARVAKARTESDEQREALAWLRGCHRRIRLIVQEIEQANSVIRVQ